MPVLSWAHSKYWVATTPPPPDLPGASARGGYIAWMPIVTTAVCFLLFVWLGA